MFNWFRRSQKHHAAAAPEDAYRVPHHYPPAKPRKAKTKRPKGGPPDRSGGFDGNQDFVTRYGDPFDD